MSSVEPSRAKDTITDEQVHEAVRIFVTLTRRGVSIDEAMRAALVVALPEPDTGRLVTPKPPTPEDAL